MHDESRGPVVGTHYRQKPTAFFTTDQIYNIHCIDCQAMLGRRKKKP